MSVAAVLRIDSPAYVDANPAPSTNASVENKMRELAHELRQPLSSIEAIAYYLEMTLPAAQFEARHYMSELQRLVTDASAILERSIPARKACARATTLSSVSAR
jgi:nitrogen-specific signal transduction histidine kinase